MGQAKMGKCNGERKPVVEFWPLNGLQYMFISQRVTWDEARMLCLNYNAKLAILDNAEKALSISQSIANSNIEMGDSWIGGRRMNFSWTWVDVGVGPGVKSEIPMEPNVENFPPWTREPTRPTKECLAIDRRSHDLPNFIDLDCRLQRPIICEKRLEDLCKAPVPSKWIQISRSTFTLYHGRVTWHEAATFCRDQGNRLAILKTASVINILTNGMTKTRPDFETVWIGAYFSYGQWTWMSTGSLLNPLSDESGYPPWRSGRPEKNEGCLLLDRHLDDSTHFIETNCDKKRDFVCEEYPEGEDEDWLNEPAKFAHGNSTYIIYPLDKTWSESRSFCNDRGSVLAHVGSIDTLKVIIEAMGDHPREIHHVWLGGEFRSKEDEWYWIGDNSKIPKVKDPEGFPPWAQIDTGLDHDPASSSCLNLDRTDHVKPHFYGLDCLSKQSFVCKITCDVPPTVKNGTWNCHEVDDGRECSLTCDANLLLMGVRNVTCTSFGGWVTGFHWLEFPQCMEPKEYTLRMIRSLSYDMQKSAGYYLMIDHMNPEMGSLSLEFAERLIKAFPVSHNLRMGMTSYATIPPTHVPFNQSDNCQILEVINDAKKKSRSLWNEEETKNYFNSDVSLFSGRRILIIAMLDSQRAAAYADSIDQFKSAGHHVTIIGLEEDWKTLLPLVTVGFDRRSNLFLFDSSELERIISELDRLDKKPWKCKIMSDSTTSTPPTVPTVLEPIDFLNKNSKIPVGVQSLFNEGTTKTSPSREGKPVTMKDATSTNSEEQPESPGQSMKSPSEISKGTKNLEVVPQIYAEQEVMKGPEENQETEQTGRDSNSSKENGEEKIENSASSTNEPTDHQQDEPEKIDAK
ncbi:uncharacterized protein [Venturia canescens]|uniref:uncharacterized protein n=1 Tax=Venturia canescens TaxID=32260 RepID=UPI001C9C9A96|nr:uncharacterized protein LOC122416584 [Venturia canescens]